MASTELWVGKDPENPRALVTALRQPMPATQAERLASRLVHLIQVRDLQTLVASANESPFLLDAVATAIGALMQEQPRSATLPRVLFALTSQDRPLNVRIAAIDALGNSETRNTDVLVYLRALASHQAEPAQVRAAAAEALEALQQ